MRGEASRAPGRRRTVPAARRVAQQAPERIAVLALALVDGAGIPLALGDPEVTPDSAIAGVLATLAALLGQPTASTG